MNPGTLLAAAGAALWGAAIWMAPPSASDAAALCSHAARPAVLPFLWRSLRSAQRSGSSAEAFAAARMLMELLPRWTDGHLVFAYRFVLDGSEIQGGDRAASTALRLLTALAILAEARGLNPQREVDLLVGTSFLVELAGRREPGLGQHLGPAPGVDPAVLADRYLAQAEAAGAGPSVREYRVFAVPGLLAGLLRAGEIARAVEVLDAVLARIPEVRDQALAAEWGTTLGKLRRRLLGDPDVTVAELATDPRLEQVIPLLR